MSEVNEGASVKMLDALILEGLAATERHQETLNQLIGNLERLTSTVKGRMLFVDRLEAFFGPLIIGKNPPLDGEQVASKAYVDDAVGRIARVLRSEMVPARQPPKRRKATR